ncbi:hypothetical protein PF049_03505 [Erythrobacteraceae bacterium WH01K]|nr:hypothetical protein PF049_03505 [Erythrobacteraceae bacterium WH01K]
MNAPMNDAGERAHLVAQALELTRTEGKVVTRADLARATGSSRSKIDRSFPEEDMLFDGVAEAFYQPQIEVMEQVVDSDLPPRRKLYEFIARRYLMLRDDFRRDPAGFRALCEAGSDAAERVRGYVDLADHYLAMIVAEAQGEGALPGLKIDEALPVINQMVLCYTMPDMIALIDQRLNERKLARIVDTIFYGLSGKDGGAAPVAGLRAAD